MREIMAYLPWGTSPSEPVPFVGTPTRLRSAPTLLFALLLIVGSGAGCSDDLIGYMESRPHVPLTPATLRDYARALEHADAVVRLDIARIRGSPPSSWPALAGEHARHVLGLLDLVNGQMRVIGRAFGEEVAIDNPLVGSIMGMTAEAHVQMIGEMAAVRADVSWLRTAPSDSVAGRLPEHLNRLDGMLDTFESVAGFMRTLSCPPQVQAARRPCV